MRSGALRWAPRGLQEVAEEPAADEAEARHGQDAVGLNLRARATPIAQAAKQSHTTC